MNLWLQNCAKGQTARCLVGQYWTWRRANKDSLPLRERARDALWSPPAGRQPAGQTDDELAGLLVRVPAAKWPASRRTAVYPSVSSLVWPPCSAEATPWAPFGPPPPKVWRRFHCTPGAPLEPPTSGRPASERNARPKGSPAAQSWARFSRLPNCVRPGELQLGPAALEMREA